MRCFVAVTVGPSITEAMAAEVPGLRAEAERCGLKVSWSDPHGWHATVKFLGEIDEERARAVALRLAEVVRDLEPFPVEATGLMTLPPRSRVPNVLALALSDDGRFGELARRVDEAISQEGFGREQRPFRPHITLGRVRAPRGWRRFQPSLEALRSRAFGKGEVRELTLYSSTLGQGPARYQAIATIALGRSAADGAPANLTSLEQTNVAGGASRS